MNKVASILLLSAVSVFAFAQEEAETLITGDIEHGGFGGPVVKLSSVNGELGVLVGGRGGWIINHSFVLGGGGYGLVSDVKARGVMLGSHQALLNFGYGGLEMEYIVDPYRVLNYSFYLLVGAGGVDYRDTVRLPDRGNMDSQTDGVFVLEPAFHVTLNVTTFMRASVAASYRYVSGVSLKGTDNADLGGPSATLTLRFGGF